jgi:hypothetical protein
MWWKALLLCASLLALISIGPSGCLFSLDGSLVDQKHDSGADLYTVVGIKSVKDSRRH